MKKKLENFIYYYKFYLIALLFIIVIAAVLIKDSGHRDTIDFVIVDDTSQMDIIAAQNLIDDFETQLNIKKGVTGFRYRTMYLDREKYKDVNFSVAGIDDYEACFTDGSIDMVITTANVLEKQKQSSEGETAKVYVKPHKVISLNEFFSEDELRQYEKYIYYINEEPVGIIFDRSEKAEEYFEDNYPTEYHYILQVAEGSADDKYVKMFIQYLISE